MADIPSGETLEQKIRRLQQKRINARVPRPIGEIPPRPQTQANIAFEEILREHKEPEEAKVEEKVEEIIKK